MKTLIHKVILKILKTLRSPFPLLDIKFMIMQQRFVFKLSVLVTWKNKIIRFTYLLLNSHWFLIECHDIPRPIFKANNKHSFVFLESLSILQYIFVLQAIDAPLFILSLYLSLYHSLPSNHISSIQNIITHLLSELSQLQSIVEIQWKQSEQEATDAFIIHSRYSDYGKHFLWITSVELIRQNQNWISYELCKSFWSPSICRYCLFVKMLDARFWKNIYMKYVLSKYVVIVG